MSGVSLYNPMTVLGKTAKPLEHPYKGKVVDVDTDPEHLGRIKVSIPELYGDYQEGSEGTLPWIYPRYFSNFSGRVKLDIPEKGDSVEIIFPYRNIYLGYYTNEPLIKSCWDDIAAIDADAAAQIKSAFLTNYPNVYGTFDRNLTGWYIDKALNEIVLFQGKTKLKFRIDTEGNIYGFVPKSVYLEIVEDVEIKVGRDVKIEVGNNVDIDVGTKIHTHVPDMITNIDNTLTLTSNANNITTPVTHIIQGCINVDKDVVAGYGSANVSLLHHVHREQGDGAPTSQPL